MKNVRKKSSNVLEKVDLTAKKKEIHFKYKI